MDDEDAAIALAAWARQQRILIAFDVRKVRDNNVIDLLLRTSGSWAKSFLASAN